MERFRIPKIEGHLFTVPTRWRIISIFWVVCGFGFSQISVPSFIQADPIFRVLTWVLVGVIGFIFAVRPQIRIILVGIMWMLLAERWIPLLAETDDGTRPTAWFSGLIWLGIGFAVIFAALLPEETSRK